MNKRSIQVLHVDDDLDLTNLVGNYLERKDTQIELQTAASIDEGLSIVSEGNIDCIISDYDMSNKTGVEFLRSVRKQDKNLPFILFTGKGSEEVASEAISMGVTDYIQKKTATSQYALLANRIRNAVESVWAQNERDRHLEAIETAREGISILDEDGYFVYVNQAYADLYGYQPNEILGEHWEFLSPADEIPYTYEEILPILNESGYWHGVTTGLRADQSTFVEDQVLARTNADGVVCTVRNITEQEENKKELKQTNVLLSTLFDALPVGVLAEDDNRDVMAVNQQLYEFFEVSGSPSEAIGKDCEQFASKVSELVVDSTEFVEQINTVASEGEPIEEDEIVRTNGQTFERSYQPIEFAGGDGHLWVYYDATDRTNHERQLKALNKTSQDLMAAKTHNKVCEIGTKAARDILGLQLNGIHLYDENKSGLVPMATTDGLTDLIGEPPVLTGDNSIAWRVYNKGDALALDNVHTDPDRYNPDTLIRSEIYLPIGDYGILIGGSTESEQFDDQDIVLGEILAGNINTALEQVSQTQQLQARERELTRQNERLEEFTSVVSHDIQNPLTVAAGNLQLAIENNDSEYLNKVKRAHDRMEALVDNLLTLAQEGANTADITPVSLTELSEGCWQNVETSTATLNVTTNSIVFADKNRLKQLFENLFANAVEHGGETVTVGALEDGFYVSDDGPGIPVDERDQVFKFGHSTSDSGTGFGLNIVKEIVETHDWKISVTEEETGGARFEITGVETDS
jgi:PAS domain S-box-containing protein